MSFTHKPDKPQEAEELKKELAAVKDQNKVLEQQTTDLQVALVELYEMVVMQGA